MTRYVIYNYLPARDASGGLTELHKEAVAERERSGQSYGTAKRELPNGGTLYYSIRPRQSNSRGARRSGHDFVEFNYRAPGEKFSKKVSREEAARILG